MAFDEFLFAVRKIVVDGELHAGRREQIEHMAADEAGTPGQQNAFHMRRKLHRLSLCHHKPAAISASSERTAATTASREFILLDQPSARIFEVSSR